MADTGTAHGPSVADVLRAQLLEFLEGSGAHMPFDAAVADFPDGAINLRAPNVAYTPWHILEHLRITQRDMLDYLRDAEHYEEKEWPVEYWPPRDAKTTPDQFRATIDQFRADNRALRDIVADPQTDLFAPLPNTPGHTILREVRLVGDHNAYHVGEFAILRQVMGTWPPNRAA